MTHHPIQPTEIDERGVRRFKKNAIVLYLLDNGGIDMNMIAGMDFSAEDRQQFAQLIGYSLSGYSELSYVTDDAYGAAALVADGVPESEARLTHCEKELAELRASLREPMARLFGIHPDDLKANGEA